MPKKRLLLFLFIIVSLSLMTYQSNRNHMLPLRFLENPLNRFHETKNFMKSVLTAPFKRMLLREQENKRLKSEISKLIIEQQACQEIVRENKRLRELLLLQKTKPGYVTAARIIAKSTDQWSNALVLDKGLSDGISKDMTAITEKGLVGKISSVSNNYSQLLLLTDINFSAAIRLQNSRFESIISGTGFRKCKLKYIPHEEEIKQGDVVITSGLDNLFPAGIPVGYVSKVNKKSTGIFQDIEVVPFVDNRKVEVVAIIKKE